MTELMAVACGSENKECPHYGYFTYFSISGFLDMRTSPRIVPNPFEGIKWYVASDLFVSRQEHCLSFGVSRCGVKLPISM
jgi:hypothetical protein